MSSSTTWRIARLGRVALLLGAACGGDDPVPAVDVVAVAAQTCDRPTQARGFGVVVEADRVVTAAHTVDGPLREVTVDDRPAEVVAIDPRTDLALLATETDTAPVELTSAEPDDGAVRTPQGELVVTVLRTGRLVVDDTTDRERYEREVHTFTPGVTAGTSGAPLVDDAGRVAGIVVLGNPTDGTAYAVTAAEVQALLDRAPAPTAPAECAG